MVGRCDEHPPLRNVRVACAGLFLDLRRVFLGATGPPTQRLDYTFASLTGEIDALVAVQVVSTAEHDKARPTIRET
jgi:hypothetical protein